jgi:hypothetical protein
MLYICIVQEFIGSIISIGKQHQYQFKNLQKVAAKVYNAYLEWKRFITNGNAEVTSDVFEVSVEQVEQLVIKANETAQLLKVYKYI